MSARPVRLVQEFTVIPGRDAVTLVAGEELRYTFEAPGIEAWAPGLVAALASPGLAEARVAALPEDARDGARELVDALAAELLLVEAAAAEAHAPVALRVAAEGDPALVDRLDGTGRGAPLRVLCQADLDLHALLAFNARALAGADPFLWVSTGAGARGYVGPLHRPDLGPCLACLHGHFRRRAEVPGIHDLLREHGAGGGAFAPTPFPEEGREVLVALARWKAREAAAPDPDPALHALHVLEAASMTVTTHPVPVDPTCEACPGR